MRIAVFGVGGVGGYFGGRLARAGQEVVFIARGEHLKAIQAKGLRVDSINGDFIVRPAQATDDPKRVGEVDVVLVAVKTWQVPEAAGAMAPLVGAETAVLPLENGVDAPSQLAAVLGAEHVLGGLCKISAFIEAPGYIRHVGLDPEVVFGELDNHTSQRVERLRQAFEQAEVNAQVPDDIQVAMWEKFIFISSVSGVGAVTRAPMGVVRTVPETRELLEKSMEETFTVAHARNVRLPHDIVQKTMNYIDGLPPGILPSMERDILDGKPSELASQNGAIERMGLESGVPTPVHAFIYHSLVPQELQARRQLEF